MDQDSELAWMDELFIDPAVSWLKMGTRALGDRPWLLVDEKAPIELARRAELLDQRRDEVLQTPDEARAAADELLSMVAAEGVPVGGSPEAHPLDRLGRSVQEDLCLLRRGDEEWELGAGVLCFPSNWRLVDKIGRPLREVHGPTAGYDPVLADRVTNLLDRLGDQTVLRRNWFVYASDELFQPDRRSMDVVVPADRCLDEMVIRSERQTLRRLPETGWIVFTIRIQHEPIGVFVSEPERRERLRTYLSHAPEADVSHRGVSPQQAAALADAIDR